MTTTSASMILSQLAALAGEALFQNVLPVISTAASTVDGNPQTILNPLTAGIFGVQLLANLQAAIPATEGALVQDVAQFASALITAWNAKLAAAAAKVTPTTIASEIAGTSPTPAGGS